MARKWQVKQNDKILGPFSVSQMRKLVAKGHVNKKTPIRSAENSIWFMAGRFPELFTDESVTSSGAVAPAIKSENAVVSETPKTDKGWHVACDGKSIGPFAYEQLSERVRNGLLTPADLVWEPGYDDWKPASSISGLFSDQSRQIKPSPPPLPSQPRFIGEPQKVRRQFLSPEDFRYPGETTALVIACGLLVILITATAAVTVGFILAVIALSVVTFKIHESRTLRRCTRVGPHNAQELYTLAETAADRLCIKLPSVFVQTNPTWNAFAIGFLGSPSIVLHTSLVNAFDRDELLFIIGHELSHVKCGHTSWLTITTSSQNVLRNPLFEIIANLLFKSWSRKSEFTCDRGGVLACRNPSAAMSALAKIELGPKKANDKQIRTLLHEIQFADKAVWNSVDNLLSTHPQTTKRIHAVAEFCQNDFHRLVGVQ
jgi:Zn-dependent protease with chaperone function